MSLHFLNLGGAPSSRTFARVLRPYPFSRSIWLTGFLFFFRCVHRSRRTMGLIVSCPRRAKVVNPAVIRVVHLNGQVDKFPSPVSIKRVLQHHPRHFICHSRDLYAVNCRPLQTAEELRLGELYFLLPFSALESDLSADSLMALAARLLAAARKEASRAVRHGRSADSMWDLPEEGRRSMYEKLGRKYDDPEVKKALGRI